jgi:membrane-bound lytic murein transglycosylase D
MQRFAPRRSVPDPRSIWKRVADSLLGRSGRIGESQSRRPRAIPLMAIGAVAILAIRGWTPQVVLPLPSDIVGESPTTQLPLKVNGRVEKWMRRFMTDQKGAFQTFLKQEGLYEEMIRGKLRDRGMPEDLLYLAMIESGLSPRATSKVKAAGVWQFMGPTAKQYGLRVDEWVDERRDPLKATDAALDYLAFLHGRYDSWYLAAAAYNAGPSRVDRALKRHAGGREPSHAISRAGDEDIYWEIIDHLPRETREYVPKILAATALARQAERYGFQVKALAPYEFDRVWVPGGTALVTVARSLGMPMKRMRELNPHLVMGVTPPGSSFPVRVPKGSSDLVIAAMGGRPQGQVAQ